MSELVTGEAVPVELRLARFPSRAIAFGIDQLVLLVVGIPVLVAAAFALAGADLALQAAVSLVVVVAVTVGIPVTVETLTRGRSLGKLALGLRVVRDDGGPVRFRNALVRGLAGVFADFYLTSGAGAMICSLLNSRGKRIGDLLAGTVVVRDRAPAATVTRLPAVPPHLAAWSYGLELSRLPDDLAMSARTYLSRSPQLDPLAREDMGDRLATAVAAYISPTAPAGTPAWAYLTAVLAERSRREAARLAALQPPAAPAQPPAQPPAPAQPPSGVPAPGQSPSSGFAPPA